MFNVYDSTLQKNISVWDMILLWTRRKQGGLIRMKERDKPLMEIVLSFPKVGGQNKIREMFDVSDVAPGMLLMVVTDRISAFDVVMESGISRKGEVLNRISSYWFKQTRNICPNHLYTDDFRNFPKALQQELMPYKEVLKGRSMLVQKADVIPYECIVRSYLLGSAFASYEQTGKICGIPLPEGLKKGDKLPVPIFTPSTKAEYGQHDQNISWKRMASDIGRKTALVLEMFSLKIFEYMSAELSLKGIELYDAKFEFGFVDDGDGNALLTLIDEISPDSFRISSGNDKDILRNWLMSVGYDKKTPIELPDWLVDKLSNAYIQTCREITNPV